MRTWSNNAPLWMLATVFLSACSQGRILKVTDPSQPAPYSAEKSARWLMADSLWENRADPKMASAALKAYRKASKQQSDIPELLTRYARANHLVATYVETDVDRKQDLYLEGARAAEKALQQHPGFRRIFEASGDESEAVREVDGPFLESAFWYAANLGRLVNLETTKVRIGSRYRLEAFIQTITKKDESLYYGGVHRFMGVMYMVLPKPNLDSARMHFTKAINMSPLYFGTHTLMAEYLSSQEKNQTEFKQQLDFVLHTPADTLPEIAAENQYEQQRARNLLSSQPLHP